MEASDQNTIEALISLGPPKDLPEKNPKSQSNKLNIWDML